MQWADHIHLRCPGNIGFLGSLIQILFPKKPKTVKYAGNWDPKSTQPLSYRLQKWIVSNTFLTRNTKVLVYGKWPNQSKNIVSFFTASYSENEIRHSEQSEAISSKEQIATSQTPRNDDSVEKEQMLKQVQLDETNRHPEFISGSHEKEQKIKSLRQAQTDSKQIATSHTPRNDETKRHPELDSGSHPNILNFIYVGGLTPGKQPLLSVQVVHQLKIKGYQVQLNMYGDGIEKIKIEEYIALNELQNEIVLHGNCAKEIIKEAYQQSHFLLFISKSEGWPKVLAEAMFWGCLPISSSVSCIPFMLGKGSRGALVKSNVNEIVLIVEDYLKNSEKYKKQTKNAMEWSRQFTLEKFEKEIYKIITN
jgi:glycosyltransferase involved in cell wall biosynthesis